MTRPEIILGSGSAIRAKILSAAGVSFRVVRPAVDEAALKRAGVAAGESLDAIAQKLADAKALAVEASGDALVIGSDQILEFEGRGFDKPETMEDAGARLTALQGAAHTLINAASVARGGKIVFRNIDRPKLSMRAMTGDDIEAYLKAAGPDILSSVGAYQVEGLGARLFDRIEGDYFAVLGLSIFPLLKFLRQEGALEF